ncbi:MAG: NosD domain-containing protein, partial [Candidatus Thorarchaeota archaeon]
MRFKLVKVSVITIAIIILVTPLMLESSPNYRVVDNTRPVVDEVLNKNMISAQAIIIDSDENFTQYGFTGSGTVEDPYVLEGQIFQNYLGLLETSAYFEIRNCRFMGSFPVGSLYLNNVSNGLVSGCTMTSGSLTLIGSVDCTLKDNIVFTESIIHGSRMEFPVTLGPGIHVESTNDSTIENNTVFHTERGIQAGGQGLIIRNNIIHSNLFNGLRASALESLYVGNSIFGNVEQVYNIHTVSASAIVCDGENSTFYMNSIGWNNDNVMISDSGGV